MERTQLKKFKCSVKLGNRKNGSAIMFTWHVNDLVKFTAFLDSSHPTWTWYNVYDVKTRQQLASYTKYDKPRAKRITADAPIIRPEAVKL